MYGNIMINNFKKPNLNAPRYREKVLGLLNAELINEFKDKNPIYSKIDNNKLKNIIKLFNGRIWEEVIKNRDGVELPDSLGYIFIGGCPAPIKKPIDIVKSKQYGQIVTHKNYDTDGHLMKIFYTNTPVKYRLKNKQIWAFSATRNFKREASNQFKKKWTKYIVVKNNDKISGNFKGYNQRKKHKEYAKRTNP